MGIHNEREPRACWTRYTVAAVVATRCARAGERARKCCDQNRAEVSPRPPGAVAQAKRHARVSSHAPRRGARDWGVQRPRGWEPLDLAQANVPGNHVRLFDVGDARARLPQVLPSPFPHARSPGQTRSPPPTPVALAETHARGPSEDQKNPHPPPPLLHFCQGECLSEIPWPPHWREHRREVTSEERTKLYPK